MAEEFTIQGLIGNWLPGLLSVGWRIIAALLILFIGFRFARIFEKMVAKSFERIEMEISLRKFLVALLHACIMAVLFFVAADTLCISSASIIAVLGSASLALGLSLQGSLANFAGGVLILLVKPFHVGDYIICSGGEGTVAVIGLVYTTLNTVDNQRVVIPNGTLSNSPLTNVTAKEKRRLDLKIGIGYNADLKLAKILMQQTYENHPHILKEEDIVVFVDELSESAVIIGGRGWTATADYWTTKWEITEQIKLAYDKAGIQIPFRQLDVHMKKSSPD